MATTMHQHLVHFTLPSIRDNTALQVTSSKIIYSFEFIHVIHKLESPGHE